MRTVQRNKREISYALYSGVTDVVDSDGNLTGEQEITLCRPVTTRMNVSAAEDGLRSNCLAWRTPSRTRLLPMT